MEIDFIRDSAELTGGFKLDYRNIDLYFDETQNIRRLWLKDGRLNVSAPGCFVLGGIGTPLSGYEFPVEDLRRKLGVQSNAPELKFLHVAKGDALTCLRSRRLRTLLGWLLESNFTVQYTVLDPLYWSMVDIIDSVVMELGDHQLYPFIFDLKAGLYTALRQDPAVWPNLMAEYDYPNVGRDRRKTFLEQVIGCVQDAEALLPRGLAELLKVVLTRGQALPALPFLEDEVPYVLISNLAQYWTHAIALFPKARLIFDQEPKIMEIFKEDPPTQKGQAVENFRFVNSKIEFGVQVSDCVVSILSRLFTFTRDHSLTDLAHARAKLDSPQSETLELLRLILDRSANQHPSYAHQVISVEDRLKAAFFIEGQ